jgi:hypothetical protein
MLRPSIKSREDLQSRKYAICAEYFRLPSKNLDTESKLGKQRSALFASSHASANIRRREHPRVPNSGVFQSFRSAVFIGKTNVLLDASDNKRALF